MQWLVILDPLKGLKAETDTSLALIREARLQGVTVVTATIDALSFSDQAEVVALDVAGNQEHRPLDDYDLIFMRKEPPYDLAFHYATQLLAMTTTPVVNSSSSLQRFNEKLIALQFPQFMPPTLVSSSVTQIEAFIHDQGTCVIKALDSFQGRSVVRMEPGDTRSLAAFLAASGSPVMVQKFLEAVYAGDKRVIMLGEHVLGAAMRKPRQGYHANFASSDALPTELTAREQRIVNQLGPWLVAQGIHFAGLDFIGENLTEINITCPTGIVQISRLTGKSLAAQMVGYFRGLAAGTR